MKCAAAAFFLAGSLFAQDEPDPFGGDEPAKVKEKKEGEEPDPFGNEAAGDPKAAEVQGGIEMLFEGLGAALGEALGGAIEIEAGGAIEITEGEFDPNAKPLEHRDADVQLMISKHLKKIAEGERRQRAAFMDVVIEDVTRLCGLSDEQNERLEIAAKGATDRSMRAWEQQADRYIHGRMKGATAKTAGQMLAQIGNVSFGNGNTKQGEKEGLWKDALDDVLEEKQIQHYKKAVEERAAFSTKAYAQVVVATVDEHVRLTPDQREKLIPLAEETTAEFLDDIRAYWGDYLQKSMMMSLIGGVDDSKVKEILTEKQFESWQQGSSDFEHFWDMKRQQQKQNQKRDAKKKKKAEAVKK